MEVIRQQNEVKYVAHNRVSDSHLPVTIATDLATSFLHRLYILLKLIVKLSRVQRTG